MAANSGFDMIFQNDFSTPKGAQDAQSIFGADALMMDDPVSSKNPLLQDDIAQEDFHHRAAQSFDINDQLYHKKPVSLL